MKNKKADTFIVILIILLIINILIIFISAIFLNDFGGANGYHTGIITAVEHRVNILWDSNLVYFKTSEESTQEDIYCVNDLELKNKLIRLSKERKMVTIYFKNDFIFLRSECNGGISVIYNVESE